MDHHQCFDASLIWQSCYKKEHWLIIGYLSAQTPCCMIKGCTDYYTGPTYIFIYLLCSIVTVHFGNPVQLVTPHASWKHTYFASGWSGEQSFGCSTNNLPTISWPRISDILWLSLPTIKAFNLPCEGSVHSCKITCYWMLMVDKVPQILTSKQNFSAQNWI